MITMWFLVVPDKAPNAEGVWRKFRVDTRKAANKTKYSRPWEHYDELCGPGHVAVVASRIPPKMED